MLCISWTENGQPTRHVVREDRLLLGSGVNCTIRGPSLAPVHAILNALDGKLSVRCLGRTTLQFRGSDVKEALLSAGDSFVLGETEFSVTEHAVTTSPASPVVLPSPRPAPPVPPPAKPAPPPPPAPSLPPPSDAVVEDAAAFRLAIEETAWSPQNAVQFSPADVQALPFSESEHWLKVIERLPRLLSMHKRPKELVWKVAHLLLDGMPHADVVTVVQYDPREVTAFQRRQAAREAESGRSWWSRLWAPRVRGEDEPPSPLNVWPFRHKSFDGRFTASRRLSLHAIHTQRSVVQRLFDVPDFDAQHSAFFTAEPSWVIVIPLRDEQHAGWCVYLVGRRSRFEKRCANEAELKRDLRFLELIVQFFGAVQRAGLLKGHLARLNSFFSPKVAENLAAEDADASLAPAEHDITVLFCDLRGFSKRCEAERNDLRRVLASVKAALSVMADAVIERDGAIADFLGDAALGFWGWPRAVPEGPVPACQAALQIVELFRAGEIQAANVSSGTGQTTTWSADAPAPKHSVGIGIAHGRALAGKIGSDRQAKIGVFGPVVNLGSRLEGLTKRFGVSICIDEATAEAVREQLPEARVRFLAPVQPAGLSQTVRLHSLVAAENEEPDELLRGYDDALQMFLAGRWQESLAILDSLPTTDGPTHFLRQYMATRNARPPLGWDGVIRMDQK